MKKVLVAVFMVASATGLSACGNSVEDACTNFISVCKPEWDKAIADAKAAGVPITVAFPTEDKCISDGEAQEESGDLDQADIDCLAEAGTCKAAMACVPNN